MEQINKNKKYSKMAIIGFIFTINFILLSGSGRFMANFIPQSIMSFYYTISLLLIFVAIPLNIRALIVCKKERLKGKSLAVIGLVIALAQALFIIVFSIGGVG